DVNGDGKVNNKDLGLLMQHLNGWVVEIIGDDGDVNGDGKINNKDYGLIMQFTNGWDITLK
ncbi:MAG: dockerin type I domain-containing protein, partial [Acutalibacteraceae bacterium]